MGPLQRVTGSFPRSFGADLQCSSWYAGGAFGAAAIMLLDLGAAGLQIHTDAHGGLQTIPGAP